MGRGVVFYVNVRPFYDTREKCPKNKFFVSHIDMILNMKSCPIFIVYLPFTNGQYLLDIQYFDLRKIVGGIAE